MRIALLALLVVISSCRKPDATEATASAPPTAPAPQRSSLMESVEQDPLVVLMRRVQPKMGPEFLDELIERANTPDSRAITFAKLKESPGRYYGHPWWFTGKLIHVRQSRDGCNLTLSVNGVNEDRMLVLGDMNIDFVRGEEVDVIGYIADHDKSSVSTMLAHSILKKGTIQERRK